MDIHAETASRLFGVPLNEVTPEMRARGKAANHMSVFLGAPRPYKNHLPTLKDAPRFLHKSFGLGFLVSKELLMDSMKAQRFLPLHLRPLDAGDELAMKQMRMDEQEYRVFLFDIEEEDRIRAENGAKTLMNADFRAIEERIVGRHFDSVVVDDLYDGPRGPRVVGANPAHAAPYGQAQANMPAPPKPNDYLMDRKAVLDAARESMEIAHKNMISFRDYARNTANPMDAGYFGVILELHEKTRHFLTTVQRYFEESSVDLGLANMPGGR